MSASPPSTQPHLLRLPYILSQQGYLLCHAPTTAWPAADWGLSVRAGASRLCLWNWIQQPPSSITKFHRCAAEESKPGGLLSRQQLAAQLAKGKAPSDQGKRASAPTTGKPDDIDSQVTADLEALLGVKRGSAPEEELDAPVPSNSSDQPWAPPQGQKGDGRTSLNAKLGY